jgi:integrase
MARANSKTPHQYRSLLIEEWPEADRRAWEEACRPGLRLKPGGTASYLGEVSREDFARRYGAFLGFLQRTGRLDMDLPATTLVIPSNVEAYIAELTARARSGNTWNCIYKLRRASELINAMSDFRWLAEIEKDLRLVMQPRSKLDRLVFSNRLVEAGLTLIGEARQFARTEIKRAIGIRNGLMITVLAFRPLRLKNFAALELGTTFREIQGRWWITLPRNITKTKRAPDESRLPSLLCPFIDLYLSEARPVLIAPDAETNALWISSRTGRRYTKKNLGSLISKLTRETLGVDVSPHLFRTAAATTAAAYAPHLPHLASAILGHSDPRITEEHYNRAGSVHAAMIYSDIVNEIQLGD